MGHWDMGAGRKGVLGARRWAPLRAAEGAGGFCRGGGAGGAAALAQRGHVLGFGGALMWGGSHRGRTRAVAGSRGGAQCGGGACRGLQPAVCAWGGGALEERRGRVGQPSSSGVADRSQGRGRRY